MAIGNCPRCGGQVDDANEYCDNCANWNSPASEGFLDEESHPFKVGDRVEIFAPADAPNVPLWRCKEARTWQLGRIVGTTNVGLKPAFKVHLDESKDVLKTIAVFPDETGTYLRPSDAPMPDKRGQLTERQKLSGRFPLSLSERDIAKQIPETPIRKPYEPNINDVILAGEEPVRLIDINREQYLVVRSSGAVLKFGIPYVQQQFERGEWRLANVADQIKELTAESDRLDTLIVELLDQRARIVERIAALKAQRGE